MRLIDAFNVFSYSFQILVLRADASTLHADAVIEAVGAGVHISVSFIFSAIAHITLTVTPFPACLYS